MIPRCPLPTAVISLWYFPKRRPTSVSAGRYKNVHLISYQPSYTTSIIGPSQRLHATELLNKKAGVTPSKLSRQRDGSTLLCKSASNSSLTFQKAVGFSAISDLHLSCFQVVCCSGGMHVNADNSMTDTSGPYGMDYTAGHSHRTGGIRARIKSGTNTMTKSKV